MDNHFDFLKQAKPASLYKLLDRLPIADAAVVLAGLPAPLSVQVMAYFPESRQGELMPVLREARQEGPERAVAVAARIRDILVAAKKSAAPDSGGVAERRVESNPSPRVSPVPQPPRAGGKPTPWIPRAASTSPINGPAVPGKPPPVDGDPLRSPLAKAGLLDLIGRAQEKLLPKGRPPSASAPTRGVVRPEPPKAAPPVKRPAAVPPPAKRPAAVEGMVPSGRIEVGRTPRVIGRPGGGKKRDDAVVPDAGGGGARRMDGKAILAAILREAGGEVRAHVRHDDPALFKEIRGRMFYFDDLIYTEDSALARVFTAAPVAESSLALRFAAPALRDRVFRVVSPGRAEALRDVKPGRAGVDAIEAAQKRVLDVALQLQAAGRILIDPRDPDLAQ